MPNFDIDIIHGDNELPSNGADLNFDIDYANAFGADIDLHETRVDGLVKLAKACD